MAIDVHYNNFRMVSENYEDKIKFVKDSLNNKSLDDILRSLKTHRNRYAQHEIHNLWILTKKKLHNLVLGI